MNFHFKNIFKDIPITLLGVFICLVLTLVILYLVHKNKVTLSEATPFLATLLPIILSFFGLAGRDGKTNTNNNGTERN